VLLLARETTRPYSERPSRAACKSIILRRRRVCALNRSNVGLGRAFCVAVRLPLLDAEFREVGLRRLRHLFHLGQQLIQLVHGCVRHRSRSYGSRRRGGTEPARAAAEMVPEGRSHSLKKIIDREGGSPICRRDARLRSL